MSKRDDLESKLVYKTMFQSTLIHKEYQNEIPMDSPKKKKRQEAILKAALKLFTLKGYFNTSVSDIQNACKMSVGTLYIYFDNKESIAITLYSNLENCLYEALCEISAVS